MILKGLRTGVQLKSILRNSGISAPFLVICLLLAFLADCSSPSGSAHYAKNPIAGRETLTQVSTIDALMAGVYDGVMSCGQLKGYGDFGIGTFEALDGEMVILEEQIYQIKADGVAYLAPDSLEVPFAAVTFFDSDREETIASDTDYSGFQTLVDEIIPSKNIFVAIKLEGNFSFVKTRSVPRQEKPYPVLADVTAKQSVFEFNNVSGTIVGFRCPQYVNGVNVPGYHLHFLTSDRKAGGHVLDFTIKQAVTSVDYTSEFLMILPGAESDFHKLDLSQDKQSELEKVEK
jgi:acetolactate decarboxylase